MNNTLRFLLIIVLGTSCSGVKKYNAQIIELHSVEELHQDVDKVYEQLQRWHPRLYQYVSRTEFDQKFDALKGSINGPMGSKEFYERLVSVVNEVRQGHLNVRPPTYRFTKKQQKELRKRPFEFYKVDFELLEDKLWVKANQGKDSLIVGHEVLAFDKDLAAKLVDKYKRLFSSDGFNTTYHNRFVAQNFSNFYYVDKGFKDSLTLLLKKNDSIYFKTLKRVAEDRSASKDSSSVQKSTILSKAERTAIKQKEKRLRKTRKRAGRKRGYVPPRNHYLRNLDFIGNDSSVAYLKIRGFGHGNYNKFYKEAFAKIDSAGSENLILDLRDNGGGSLDEIEKLYGYLSLSPFRFMNDAETKTRIPMTKAVFSQKRTGILNEALRILGSPGMIVYDMLNIRKKGGKLYRKFSGSKIKSPRKKNFRGKIYVLINGYSFSAASMLATNLQANRRAFFVGEETGGSYNGTVAGQTKYIELPNSKVLLYFGLLQIETPHKTEPDGYGVKPDVEIIPTQKDRLQNRDPELEWVLKDIFKN